MRPRVSIQAKQSFSRSALQHIALGVHVSRFHIDFAVVESEGGHVAITVEGHVSFHGGNEWVDHDAEEGAVDFFGDFSQDYQVRYLPFEATGEIGSIKVLGRRPLALELRLARCRWSSIFWSI